MKFDPETKKFVAAFIIMAVFSAMTRFTAGYILAGVFVILALFSLYFFRDPDRNTPEDESLLVSPADGKVVFVGKYDDPAFGKSLRIGIFMSIFDIHINRSPCSGVVELLEYVEGGFGYAGNPNAFGKNERQVIFITNEHCPIIVHQIAGMVARRIVCRVSEGQNLERGERIGIIRFGSRVETIAPFDKVETLVKVGDRVKCGTTPIARWV